MNSSRRLRRFFSSHPILKSGQSVTLEGPDAAHLKDVLRLKPRDRCLVVDGLGHEAEAVIQKLSSAQAHLMTEKITSQEIRRGNFSLILYPALAQKGVLDNLVRKAQELGVSGFRPVSTERSQFSIPESQIPKVLARWKTITREAAKQSGAPRLVEIEPPKDLKAALAEVPPDGWTLVFHPDPSAQLFRDWVDSMKKMDSRLKACGNDEWVGCGNDEAEGRHPRTVLGGDQGSRLHLFFGPEGGFSAKEIEFIKKMNHKNFYLIQLGTPILRVETAVLSVVSALRLMLQ